MKSNLEIIIRHLTAGHEIPFGNGFNLVIHEGNLYWKSAEQNDPEQEWLYPCELTFNGFVKFCEKFTKDEIFIMGAEMALTEMNREKPKR